MQSLFSQAQLCQKLIKSNLAKQGFVIGYFLLIYLLFKSFFH